MTGAPLTAEAEFATFARARTETPDVAWWWREPLLPTPTARLLQLDDRTVLHCERAQALFELNRTAAQLWRSLTAGDTPETAASELQEAGFSAADARRFVEEAASAWLDTGRLTPAAAVGRRSEPPVATLMLNVGGAPCAIELHSTSGDPLHAELERLFGQFRAAGAEAQARLSVVRCGPLHAVFDRRGPRGLLTPERVVPEVKAFVTERLSRATGGGAFLVHAALLAAGGRGLLLSGAPGAGKTTLTLALASRGLGYATDDVVRVSPSGALEGVRFRPACKEGAWALLEPYTPDLGQEPEHLRADGRRVRYAPVRNLGSGEVHRLGWVLLLDRRPGARAALEPVERVTALAALLEGAYSADGELKTATLEGFVAQLSGADCRRLVYSDLAEAVAAVEALVGG